MNDICHRISGVILYTFEQKSLRSFITHSILIVIVLTLFLHQFRMSHLVLMYFVDNETFTEWFCENTDKPEMECNGQCHLKKVSEQENKNPISHVLDKEIVLFHKLNTSINFFVPRIIKKSVFNTASLYNKLFQSVEAPPPWC